jgi:hypothetical protein
LFVLALGSSANAAAGSAQHYFDPAGNALVQYEPVWRALHDAFGEHAPPRIIVQVSGGQFSQFDTRHDRIYITAEYSESRAVAIVAHESAHLAAHNVTTGYSTQNQFRFIDEGYASVFANRVSGNEVAFKAWALEIAARQQRKDNVRLHLVQDWRTYWGSSRNGRGQQTEYAYPVGASFIYYLTDIHGAEAPMRFMKAIADTGDLHAAARLSLEMDGNELEAGWITYLAKVALQD